MPSKISIIIPTYNEEENISKCIYSLENQSYKNFEILVIDDGSKDNTKKIIKKYKRVKLIEGEHKGPGFSRNIGAKNAEGEILVFVDADMTFDKNYLKDLIKPILDNKELIGTTHETEIAKNIENIWSRCWGKERITPKYQNTPKIFRAIRNMQMIKHFGLNLG
jgi:glycosyltransferase involved in cell wall biosynthesis